MLAAAPLFALVVIVLSATNQQELRSYGWRPLDHHGVPWPSSLAVLPYGGWLILAFGLIGLATLALARALPQTARSIALSVAGLGLVAAMFPLDAPAANPGVVTSWVHSAHAWLHLIGFLAVGLAVPVAMIATRRRRDMMLAVATVAVAVAGGALGWYAFLLLSLGWLTTLAARASREPVELRP
jgi:hypothetical protein